MRRSPEAQHPAAVMGPDGRLAPFDQERLAASLRRALTPARGRPAWPRLALAEDLADVVAAYLRRSDQGPLVSCEELAGLVQQVLVQADQEGAARRHAARRLDPPDEPAPPPSVNRLVTASERSLAGTLVREHALRAVLPRDAVSAWARGLLNLDPWLSANRLPAATLAPEWAAEHGRGRRVDPARLGAALRGAAGLVVDELVLPWEGALPSGARLTDLAHHLVDPLGRGARLVLELPADRAAEAGDALAALAAVPEAPVGLCLEGGLDEPPAWIAGLPAAQRGRLRLSRAPARRGAVLAAAELDLAALAGCVPPRDTAAFLAVLEEHVDLALCSLLAWASSEPVTAAREALWPAVGRAVQDRLRLVLTGVERLRRDLLGDGALARANHGDLLASVGGVLRRGLRRHPVELRVPADTPDLPLLIDRLGLDEAQPVAATQLPSPLLLGDRRPCA